MGSAQAFWSFTLYPEAGEGGGCFRAAVRRPPVGGGRLIAVRAQEEAARRARAKIRRYCAANRLNRLGTLTYAGAGCHDPQELRGDLAGFFRGLRAELGGEPFPYPVGAGVASGRARAACRTSRSAATSRRADPRGVGSRARRTSSCSAICRSARARSRRRGWRPATWRSTWARTSATSAVPRAASVRGRAGLPAGAVPLRRTRTRT